MSIEISYTCDVCRDKIAPEEIMGVVFSGMKTFTLVSHVEARFRDHQGVHICYRCAGQISAQYTPQVDCHA